VIDDKHGLPIASKIHPKISMSEQLLSLEAVAEGRKIVNISNFDKLIAPLSKNVKLMMLLKKSKKKNLRSFKALNKILQTENPI